MKALRILALFTAFFLAELPGFAEESEHPPWSLTAYTAAYFVPDSSDYFQPTLTADHDWLHLEARYNYESSKTGSAWIGFNLAFGKTLMAELTPIVGVVFGNLTGVAPGFKATLNFWKLELYSENEYVIDFADRSEDFFYTWTELSVSPAKWFRAGLVLQKTQAYQTELATQQGLLMGVSYRHLSFTGYVFNPVWDDPFTVLAAELSF